MASIAALFSTGALLLSANGAMARQLAQAGLYGSDEVLGAYGSADVLGAYGDANVLGVYGAEVLGAYGFDQDTAFDTALLADPSTLAGTEIGSEDIIDSESTDEALVEENAGSGAETVGAGASGASSEEELARSGEDGQVSQGSLVPASAAVAGVVGLMAGVAVLMYAKKAHLAGSSPA